MGPCWGTRWSRDAPQEALGGREGAPALGTRQSNPPPEPTRQRVTQGKETALGRLLWSDSARQPTQPITLLSRSHTPVWVQTHPWKGTQSLHLCSHRVKRTRVPPAYLRLCWALSTKSASASAETWLSPPRGGRYINPASDYACSGKRTLSCLLLSISPPDFLWRLPSSLCHCVALEQGPYLTRVSPPSCDHDFQVLGRTSFSLRSPIDEGSSSSGSQPSNCLIFSLQLPRTTGGTLKCKDTGKKTVTLANITDT